MVLMVIKMAIPSASKMGCTMMYLSIRRSSHFPPLKPLEGDGIKSGDNFQEPVADVGISVRICRGSWVVIKTM